ncbi:MAG: hypothetical protein FJZ95_00960, partial [Chloroflexi bacterium]|nr:hypothetical protein [Chloroflexota bacterium]
MALATGVGVLEGVSNVAAVTGVGGLAAMGAKAIVISSVTAAAKATVKGIAVGGERGSLRLGGTGKQGLITPSNYFGNRTYSQVEKALTTKFGAPRGQGDLPPFYVPVLMRGQCPCWASSKEGDAEGIAVAP